MIYDDRSNLDYCLRTFDDYVFNENLNIKLILSGINNQCRLSTRFLSGTKNNGILIVAFSFVVGNECAENHMFYGFDPSIMERGLRILYSRMYQKYAVISGDEEYQIHSEYAIQYLKYLQADCILLGEVKQKELLIDLIKIIKIRMAFGGVIIYMGLSSLFIDFMKEMERAGISSKYDIIRIGTSNDSNKYKYEVLTSFIPYSGTPENTQTIQSLGKFTDDVQDRLVIISNVVNSRLISSYKYGYQHQHNNLLFITSKY